jgi:hypothetical protein
MDSDAKSSLIGMAIIISAVVACALTNPSKQEHLDAIGNKNGLVGGVLPQTE